MSVPILNNVITVLKFGNRPWSEFTPIQMARSTVICNEQDSQSLHDSHHVITCSNTNNRRPYAPIVIP